MAPLLAFGQKSSAAKRQPGWKSDTPQAITLQHIRKGVGFLAIALPFVTGVGYWVLGRHRGGFLDSISESYYTLMRDAFVGTLCMEALFLYAYRGYNDLEDRIFNVLAGLCVLIAFFSMNPKPGHTNDPDIAMPPCHPAIAMDSTCLISLNNRTLICHHPAFGYVHITAAALLFACLGAVSFFFFTKTAGTSPTRQKLRRNLIYRGCGIAIWSSIVLYGLFWAAGALAPHAPLVAALDQWLLFAVETVCLLAFGFSWQVKGDGVWGAFSDESLPASPQPPPIGELPAGAE